VASTREDRTALARVVVVDDHGLILEGVRLALEETGSFEIVGEASSGSEVLPLVARTEANLVLLDMRLPGMDGLRCLELIRREHPDVKVVMLSIFVDEDHIRAALERGASAYIAKTIETDDLPAALTQVLQGDSGQVFGLVEASQNSSNDAGLTEREIVILRAVARGLSNQAIARELWVTEQTVKFHLTNTYRKLNVANRTEAARYAYEHGLVENRLNEYV
jgi:two-component system, NarL family, response regulator LiaR